METQGSRLFLSLSQLFTSASAVTYVYGYVNREWEYGDIQQNTCLHFSLEVTQMRELVMREVVEGEGKVVKAGRTIQTLGEQPFPSKNSVNKCNGNMSLESIYLSLTYHICETYSLFLS